ncbi:MAG: OmpH family outer membrane protein [Phycisphaerae bacterium]|nr:OmpH family outer membrane protein [Phycisphaerae bacterium]
MRFGKVHVVVLVLVLALGLTLVSFTRTEAQNAAGASAATRTAVCNIVEIFGEYQKAKDMTADLNKQREMIEAENNQRLKKAEVLQTQLEGYKADSPKYDETLEEIQRQQINRQVWLRMKQEEILRKHRRLTEEMFREFRIVIAEVAKEKGFDLVLQSQPVELQNAQNVQQVIAQIDRQKVLYEAPGVDITAVVLQRLNEGYKLQKK